MNERDTKLDQATDRRSRWGGLVIGGAAFIVAFVSAAFVSRWLTTTPGYTPLWLPAGVTVGVFACSPRKHWWWLLLALTVATYLFNVTFQPKPTLMIVGFWFANVSRTLVAAILLQSMTPGRLCFDEPRRLFWFIFVACLPAPFCSAMFATWGIVASTGASAMDVFLAIYAGNMVGLIVATPLTMVVMQAIRTIRHRQCRSLVPHLPTKKVFGRTLRGPDWMEGILLLLGTAALSIFVFYFRTEPLSYLLLPCLLLLALRFEVPGVAVGLFLLTVVTMACTALGHGEFANGRGVSWRLTLSQLYLTTCGVSFFTLAASLAQQRRLSERFRDAQSKLASVSEETKQILDAIPAMVFYKNNQNQVVRINRSAAQWLEMIQRHFGNDGELTKSAETDFWSSSSDWQVLQTGQSMLASEERVELPCGEVQWVLADRIPLSAPRGRRPGLLTVWTDITPRKQMEDALTQSNQDLERFASIASHDLKEPLRAIGGYCRLLEEDFGTLLDDEGKRYVRSAIEGAERMNRLIDDLLEYSRVSRSTLKLRDVTLENVVAEAVEILDSRIRESRAQIQIENLPIVRGAFNPLVQVFQNLISNSIKFVAPGELPIIRIDSDYSCHHQVVTVRDNGVGIDPKYHQKVFDIFSRLNHRQDYEGTGLGLAICKRIMQKLGGKVVLHSPTNGGTHVQLWFPVSDGQGSHSEQQADSIGADANQLFHAKESLPEPAATETSTLSRPACRAD